MHDGDDDNSNDDDEGHPNPPPISRLERGRPPRRYRELTRYRTRDRVARQRRQLPIAELLGIVIKQHGLTDEARQRFVCLYWDDIADRIAAKTWPVSFSEGVLHIEAETSTWVHELQFHKTNLIAKINAWIDANRVWLGPPPLVHDLRFELGMRRNRPPLVEREQAYRLRARQLRRLWQPRVRLPPIASESEREAIRAETGRIADVGVRAVVEALRVKWNL